MSHVEERFVDRRHYSMRQIWVIALLTMALITSCGQSKPLSPDPQAVLAVLRQYPGGTRIEDRILQQEGDVMYRISFAVQTTSTAAIAYYDPLLRTLGMEKNPSIGPTRDDLPVDYFWMYYGCPYPAVQITTTAQKLQITYGYGPCR
jgi:hypothetical protein